MAVSKALLGEGIESFALLECLGGRPGRPRFSLICELFAIAGELAAFPPLAAVLVASILSVSLPLAAMLALMDCGADCYWPAMISSCWLVPLSGVASEGCCATMLSSSVPGVWVAVRLLKRCAAGGAVGKQLLVDLSMPSAWAWANSAHFCSDEPRPASLASLLPRRELCELPELCWGWLRPIWGA